VELLKDLAEPSPSVHIRELHDGRTISSAEKRGLIMEYYSDGSRMFLRTEAGGAFLLLEDGE